MTRTIFSKVMWVGRTTVFLVGLAVILALVFGVATSALGANGKPFLLGRANVATLVSTLVKKGPGPALSLRVGAGQPPLAVNSKARVANLNAASAGRADSAASADNATNAQNADTLDSRDSDSFAPAAAEAWHELGAAGEPTLTNSWRNSGGSNSTAAFYKDPWGVVHLKGMVENPNALSGGNYTMFVLPCGYGPSKDEAHAVLSNNALGRVTIYRSLTVCPGDQTSGWVRAMPPSNNVWVSLDGITFRAADS